MGIRVVAMLLVCIAGGCRVTPVARLRAADAEFRRVDNTYVFTLPDSGGFLINGQPVPRDAIPAQVAALFAPRASGVRAIMVWDNPARRVDAQWLSQVAMADSGRAFDAELSGWPHEIAAPH